MAQKEQNPPWRIELERTDPEVEKAHSVPASLLAKQLQTLQDLVYLAGMTVLGRSVNQRLKIPADVKSRFSLSCELPEFGSYAVPVDIDSDQQFLLEEDETKLVEDKIEELMRAVSQRDYDALAEAIPDERIRARALGDVKELSKGADGKFVTRLTISESGTRYEFNRETSRNAQKLALPESESEEELQSLIGVVEEIDFSRESFQIGIPNSRHRLTISFSTPGLTVDEETIIASKLEPLQIIGHFKMKKGYPDKVVTVHQVHHVDLSPMRVTELPSRTGSRSLIDPITLEPRLDESGQLFIVEYPPFSIQLAAYTREELDQMLAADLEMLWDDYGRADDATLSRGARRLKRNLLKAVGEEG